MYPLNANVSVSHSTHINITAHTYSIHLVGYNLYLSSIDAGSSLDGWYTLLSFTRGDQISHYMCMGVI